MLGGGFRNYFMYKSACFCIFVVILRFTTAAGDVNYKVRVFERVFFRNLCCIFCRQLSKLGVLKTNVIYCFSLCGAC